MKVIDNNFLFSVCPCCKSESISKTGNLQYAKDLQLSTHDIRLNRKPELWKCNRCNSSFTQNAIPPLIAEELYASGNGSGRWAEFTFEWDKPQLVIDYFKSNFWGANMKLLDIGCNTGLFLDFAKKNGFETYGLEICKESCDIVKSKGHTAYYNPGEISGKFDIITAFDVIEHLYDFDGFIKSVHEMLSPSGLFIVFTGNPLSVTASLARNKWWYYNYPEHVVFPSPEYFRNFIAGFSVNEISFIYASKRYEEMRKNIFIRWASFFLNFFLLRYNGRNAVFPDHQFVVMKRK